MHHEVRAIPLGETESFLPRVRDHDLDLAVLVSREEMLGQFQQPQPESPRAHDEDVAEAFRLSEGLHDRPRLEEPDCKGTSLRT